MKEFAPYLAISLACIVSAIFRYLKSRNTNATALEVKKIEARRDVELEKIRLRGKSGQERAAQSRITESNGGVS